MAEGPGRSTPDGARQPDAPRRGGKPRREWRLARHARHARTVWNDPRALRGLLRDGLIDIWRSRGGGFFGLGYVVTFVLLEVQFAVGEFEGSASLMEFLGNQLLEYLFRLGVMSFVNALLAFLWPVLLLEQIGGWGLVALPVGYLAFERWLRPGIEARIPELRPTPRRKRRGRRRAGGRGAKGGDAGDAPARDGPEDGGAP